VVVLGHVEAKYYVCRYIAIVVYMLNKSVILVRVFIYIIGVRITITSTTIDLVRRLQIERRSTTMSGTLKYNKTGTV